MKHLLSVCLSLLVLPLAAQDFSYLRAIDTVYSEDIKSIEFRLIASKSYFDNQDRIHDAYGEVLELENEYNETTDVEERSRIQSEIAVKDNNISMLQDEDLTVDVWSNAIFKPLLPIPTVSLSSTSQLIFAFDDLAGGNMNFSYTLLHYNWDWKEQSNLSENEYLQGFETSDIEDFNYSELSMVPYTSYRFLVPNQELMPAKSGNYLLVVYDRDSEEVYFTRRIYCIDHQLAFAKGLRPPSSLYQDTLQEISFSVRYDGAYGHISPDRDIRVRVLQNGRHDNAVEIQKTSYSGNNTMRFGYQTPIRFHGGKEFRFFDTRSLQFRGTNTAQVTRGKDYYKVLLNNENSRHDQPIFDYQDINGQFVTTNSSIEHGTPDYALVYFTLKRKQAFIDADVYVFGRLTDWQLKDEFRLSYNPRARQYEGDAFLKQGRYDYYYVTSPRNSNQIDITRTEGNSYQTNNLYTILVYYSPPNARYDALIATKSVSSHDNFLSID